MLFFACRSDKIVPKYVPQAFDSALVMGSLSNSDWDYLKIPFSGKGEIQDFAFLNERQGGVIMQYQGANFVWITQDGGESWKLLSDTEQIKFLDIVAFDNGELLLAGINASGISPCTPGPFQWRSSDGGLSWEVSSFAKIDNYTEFFLGRDGSGFRKDIEFVPSNKNLCAVAYGGSNISLMESLDYGKSWQDLGGCGWLGDTSSTSDPNNADCKYNTNASMSIQLYPQQSEAIFAFGETFVQDPDFRRVQSWLVKPSSDKGFVPFQPYAEIPPSSNRYFWQGNQVFFQEENTLRQHSSTDNGQTWTPANYPEAAGGIWHPTPGSQQIIATYGNQFCIDAEGDFSFECFNLPNDEQFVPIPKSFMYRDWAYQKVDIINPNSLWTVVDDGLVYLSR